MRVRNEYQSCRRRLSVERRFEIVLSCINNQSARSQATNVERHKKTAERKNFWDNQRFDDFTYVQNRRRIILFAVHQKQRYQTEVDEHKQEVETNRQQHI
jgi:hypothetical protein